MLTGPGDLLAENPFDLIGRKWFNSSLSWEIAAQERVELGTVIPPDQWKKKKPVKPVMTLFVTDFCGPCASAKAALTASRSSLPVQLNIVHTSSGKVPGWVSSFPTFYWLAADGTWRQYAGWPGTDALLSSWRQTQVTRKSAGYTGRSQTQWTFPGTSREELLQHLQAGQHAGKFTKQQLQAMTFEELLSLHADDHMGQVAWEQLPRPPPL